MVTSSSSPPCEFAGRSWPGRTLSCPQLCWFCAHLWPKPRVFSLAAGNTQNLECCSHFRTSLPPPQHYMVKVPHKSSAGIQCTFPRKRFQTCSHSNSSLSCFSVHAHIWPPPNISQYLLQTVNISAAALLQQPVTAVSGTHTQSFPGCTFPVTNIPATVPVAGCSVTALITISLHRVQHCPHLCMYFGILIPSGLSCYPTH